MGEAKTRAATNCPDCSLVARPRTDPLTLLNRLPAPLWNRDAPTEETVPALRAGDIVGPDTVFGPLGSADATPQYEIARIVADEKDVFVQGWQQREAEQLGLGDAEVINGQFVSPNPRASGRELDRLLAQYGIPRPWGFTDCCAWRLYELLLWQRGNTRWLLQEVAELYTGTRPSAEESRAKIILEWPELPPSQLPYGTTFFNGSGFLNRNAFFVGDAATVGTEWDSFWLGGEQQQVGSFWGSHSAGALGLTVRQALSWVKPVGVALELVREPIPGLAGCCGATTRRPATGRGRWG